MRVNYILIPLLITSLVSCTKDESLTNQSHKLTLIYMIADNNLDYFAVSNINDMERGYNSNMQGDLLVYIDRSSNGKPSHPYLMQIVHDTSQLISSKIIRTYPEQNSANPLILKQVIDDANSFGQYSSIGLVLWSHGNAWLPSGTSLYSGRSQDLDSKQSTNSLRSFGEDEVIENNKDTTCEMDIKSLASTLNGYYFDFLVFDACYMGAIEVAYELRNINKYFIASPTEILSSGFPYEKIVPLLFEKEINPFKISQMYYDFYASQKGALCSGSIAVVNSAKLNDFANAVYTLNNRLYNRGLNENNITLQKDSLQQYDRLKVGVLFDLKEYLSKVTSLTQEQELATNIQDLWTKTIMTEFHTKSMFSSLVLGNCNGLSTYLPNKQYIDLNEYYKTLSWYKDSGSDKIFVNSN